MRITQHGARNAVGDRPPGFAIVISLIDEGIAIVQRIGKLYPKTPTVLIACTAAHRDTGVFEAARYGIDRLKEIVPIWKKEVSPDGQFWVEGDYIPKAGE